MHFLVEIFQFQFFIPNIHSYTQIWVFGELILYQPKKSNILFKLEI